MMDVEEAFRKHISHIPMTIAGTVKEVLADDSGSSPHQRFIVTIHSGHTVLIAHNLERAYRIPVKAGDPIEAHGEYVWNKFGGILHNTHHSERGEHDDGWINYAGIKHEGKFGLSANAAP